MKKTELKVTRYQVTDKFYVEVIKEGEMVEFWLGHTESCKKQFMFGCTIKDCPETEYEKFIEGNVFYYIPLF